MKGQAVLVSLVLFLIVLLTMACAGRDPVMIDVKRPSDDTLTCAQLRDEVCECTKIILEKHHIGKKKTEETIGAAVAGYVIFPPLLFAMDLKKADYKEMGAYQKRRDHLIELAKEQDCTWCEDVETDEELMMRAEAEYQELKKQRQKENTTNLERGH
jgi:hypothetical protein